MKRLSAAQMKERLVFSMEHKKLDWNQVIFTGWNRIDNFKMWGLVSRFGTDALRVIYRPLTSIEYISILNELILPMWNQNQNLVFMQDGNDLTKSNLVRSWCADNPGVTFVDWPEDSSDINPFHNSIWWNLNNRIEYKMLGIAHIYDCWRDTKEDLNNYALVYDDMDDQMQEVINRIGNYIN